MKIACASDLHGFWREVAYPNADILCLAGDILYNSTKNARLESKYQLLELQKLNQFLGELKEKQIYKEIIMIAGNHDFVFEQNPLEAQAKLTNVHYLQDSEITIERIKFYGSPHTQHFFDWAFNFPKFDPQDGYRVAKQTWTKIPVDTQILIVHGPPLRILDTIIDGTHVGDPILKDKILQLPKLQATIWGHIHHSYGMIQENKIQYINACVCNEDYEPTNPIQIITI